MATILVIDDEAPIRANLRRLLELEGHAVTEAENGGRGMALALAGGFDLILCDVMMPEPDGFELLTRLRADPAWREVPFVFLTASAENDNRRHGLALGADEYLTKPFTRQDILALVQRRLDEGKA